MGRLHRASSSSVTAGQLPPVKCLVNVREDVLNSRLRLPVVGGDHGNGEGLAGKTASVNQLLLPWEEAHGQVAEDDRRADQDQERLRSGDGAPHRSSVTP